MDIMIDIESLDTTPDCVILTIGAVLFDPRGSGIVDKIEIRPTIEEAMGDEGRIPFADAMAKLYKFCWNHNNVWSNGAGFDIVAMEHAWRQLGQNSPWPYYKVRDTRTIYEVTGVSLKDGNYTTTHKAVEDAERQAIILQNGYVKLMKAGLVQPR